MQAVSFPHTSFHSITINRFFEVSFRTGKKDLGLWWYRKITTLCFNSFQSLIIGKRQAYYFKREMRKAGAFTKKLLNIFFTA